MLFIGLLSAGRNYAEEDFRLGDRYAVIIAGISGQEMFKKKIYSQTKRMYDLLVFELSYSTTNVFYLAEDPTMDTDRINGVASQQGIRKVFADLGTNLDPEDQLFVFLAGHGSYDGVWGKFNIVGPDDVLFVCGTGTSLDSYLRVFQAAPAEPPR